MMSNLKRSAPKVSGWKMDHEFQWPPSDDDLKSYVVVLQGQRAVEKVQPRESDVSNENRVSVRAGDPVAVKEARVPHVTQVDVATVSTHPIELALRWPQEPLTATTAQKATINRVATIDRTTTGPPWLDTPRSHGLIASRHRRHFASSAATVAVSMVCASVATSYVERHDVFKPSVDAIRRLVGPVLNRSATFIRPPDNQAEVTARSSAVATLPPASPRKKQVEPVLPPAKPQSRKLDVWAVRRDVAHGSAPSQHQGSAPPSATPSRLNARIDRRAIPKVTTRAAVTSPKVVSSDSSDRSVKSPPNAVISTTPAAAVGRGGIAEARAPSVPVAPPAPVSAMATAVAPLPVPAVPARDALAAEASSTSAALLASPAGASTATVVPTRVQEEQNIRRVLQRYALAYEQLDAHAAQVVWPTVDVRALTRAFESLESQALAFSGCELSISGAEAQAACHGNATYVPKIGSKAPRTARRDWVFKLKKLEAGWTIAQAETR
jgi:hypothetical protein